jgi:GT2 family glycosyltransferase
VLFTDDDCAPEPGWAEALARVLSDEAVAVAGVTETARPGSSLAVASQQIADSLSGASSRVDGTAGFAPSSNLGVRSELVSALGFDESHGGAGGEDRDWCARLLHSGHAIRVVPAAVVHHHQELSLLAFWRKHAGYGRGARIFRRRHPRSGAGAARFQLNLLRDALTHGLVVGAAVLLAQIATAGGYLAERVGERRRRGLSFPPAGRARESRPL